jgi:glycerophosphoryl diester phosphodiesterase
MTKKFILHTMPFMFLFAGITIFEPWLYRNVLTSTNIENILKTDFEIIAHKGASGLAPENTIASFQKALDLGVDMVELDVRQTKDEEIIVFHDQFLDRTTNGTGDIHNYTLEELQQFDAGSWYDPKFSDQKIPTLKEVLDLINGQCKVLIEIKHMDHPHYHDFSDKLVDIVREEKNGFDWIILQSYEDKYLEEAHAYDERILTKKMLIGEDSAPLIAFYIETRMHLGRAEQEGDLMALNPEYTTLSPRRVFRMHARGYKVYTYSVNEREDMIKMLNMGVDGIITDYPDRLIKIREELEALSL